MLALCLTAWPGDERTENQGYTSVRHPSGNKQVHPTENIELTVNIKTKRRAEFPNAFLEEIQTGS